MIEREIRICEVFMKTTAKKDTLIILSISFISAMFYIAFEGNIMEYGRNMERPLFFRFLPVLLIQFGMSCLGVIIVFVKNKEKLLEYGFVRKNALLSIVLCMLVAIPTVLFLWWTNDIQGFLPFQGMFLTKEVMNISFPMNVLGYVIIATVWGFGEGLFYVVLADKINVIKKPKGIWNVGALVCALISILIHGMIGVDIKTIIEGTVTFILMYGSLLIHEKTENAWGNILIFFVVWNAL